MGSSEVSYLSIASLIVLLIPMIIINNRLGLKINTRIIYAIGRMALQLTLVGIFLQYIFDINNSFLNLAYLILMILVASFSTARSSKFKVKQFVLPLFFAFVIPNLIILMFFNAFVIKLDNLFHAQYLITIGGMLFGNTLNGNIVCINNFYNILKGKRNEYSYFLSFAGNKREALMPYFKESIMASVNPTIASIETIGLVALPGMMTGQILGGAVPMTAIKYQIAIMIAILVARYFSAILSIVFTSVNAFDEYDNLKI